MDSNGRSGLAGTRRDTKCFTSLGVAMRYVNVMHINAVVGSLFVGGRHVVLLTREVNSNEQMFDFWFFWGGA